MQKHKLSFIAVSCFTLALASCGRSEKADTPPPPPATTSVPSAYTPESKSQVVVEAPWVYDTVKGSSRAENVYSASVPSTNNLDFDWPFNSGKQVVITLKRSKGSSGVQVSIPEVTFSKGYTVAATFDSSPVQTFSGSPGHYGELGSNTYGSLLFIEPSPDFIASLRKAHHLSISFPDMTQAVQLEFNVSGLKWK